MSIQIRAKTRVETGKKISRLSACSIGLWGTITYTEFDCATLLAVIIRN